MAELRKDPEGYVGILNATLPRKSAVSTSLEIVNEEGELNTAR